MSTLQAGGGGVMLWGMLSWFNQKNEPKVYALTFRKNDGMNITAEWIYKPFRWKVCIEVIEKKNPSKVNFSKLINNIERQSPILGDTLELHATETWNKWQRTVRWHLRICRLEDLGSHGPTRNRSSVCMGKLPQRKSVQSKKKQKNIAVLLLFLVLLDTIWYIM